MKKGSVYVTKDGGPHNLSEIERRQFSHKNQFKPLEIHASEIKIESPGISGCRSSSESGVTEWRKNGVIVVSAATNRIGHVEKEDSEVAGTRQFEWMKPDIQLNDVDMLEMDTCKDSNMPSSLTMSIGSGSDLTDHLADFVFTSSLPDSGNVKREYNNYFEILENADHLTPNTFTEQNISWESNIQGAQPISSTPTLILAQSQNPLAHYNPETSTFRQSTDSVVVQSNNSTGGDVCIPSHHSSVAGAIDNGPEMSNMKIVQYPTSNFIDGLESYSSETLTSSAPFNSSQYANPVSLAINKNVDTGTFSSVSDVTNDITLNQLPNFLGLDVYTSSNSLTSESSVALNDNAASLLEPMELPSTATNKPMEQINQISFTSKTTENHTGHNIALGNKNLNITTISISNDDDYATKIFVDTHEGQQQMYVINAEELSQLQNPPSVSHLYIINDHQELEHSNNKQCIISSDPVFTQANNFTTVNQTQSTAQIQENSLLAPSEFSGFVLMPLVENSASAVQSTVPKASESELKRLPKKPLACPEPGCQKTFKKASKLKVHQMMHTGERPFKCTLMGCEWAFTTSNKLKRHLESHEGRKDFVCDKPGCGRRFTTIYNLNTHRKLHERPCTKSCPQEGCEQSFPTNRQLDRHLRNVHGIEEHTYKCPEPGCEKVFFSSGCMGSHMKVHRQNLEDLRCKHPGCGKQFTKLCRLRQHQQLHSGEKPFVCTFQGCHWAFATASKLKRHQTKHTGYRKWVCSICQKQFQRSEHLKGHLITHSGDRPFVCPVNGCGNTFAAKSSLYVHLKKHDESGKTIVYHCPMENCNNFYANKASLRQHILVKHCSLPNKGGANGGQIMSSWLSLLASGEDSYNDEVTSHQTVVTANQDALLASDFLTGGVVDPTLLNPSNDSLPGDPNTSGGPTVSSAAAALLPHVAPQTQHQQQQPQHKQILLQGLQLMDEQEFLQQQERMSHVAVERGKKSQIMLENMHGSARTDTRSNDIMSQRALQRWQKQKEEEAAKLRAKLDAQEQSRPQPPSVMTVNGVPPSPSSSMTVSGDYKSPVSNNVSLGGRGQQQYFVVSRSSGGPTVTSIKEISDLELESEGLTDMLDSDVGPDSFMTELFVKDPDTGITYRQTQLLQDDPPNHGLLGDMDGMGGLDVNFVEDSLTFHPME
ncbi:Zinc finger protein zxdc-like [Plakobranchus ocellatus]|uniref:Zinc finger protein zxdc-like n=1 Tax=Plakobranchus ocellatus TaxID=259542 RepID=A0AAV3ZA83_9GAST|nr:Zinc finger protein zxdc-like [Plakobranchus ocellatus]